MTAQAAGVLLLRAGLGAAILTTVAYLAALARPNVRRILHAARVAYALTALSMLGTFATLAVLVCRHQYQYDYVWEHTGNSLHGWYLFAATWAAQEGSFLLWAAWTSIIGFLVLARAGKYESRVMPIYVTVLGFLAAILLKQSPFGIIPAPSHTDLLINPAWHYPPTDGRGLNPSLVNYWMTIHPPTIFFGFASLAVPFCYAIAALLWRDYDGWTTRVMPYSLLSSATLGIGLFMGGYWAYETLGWHGFWAWDPVENASFFPWLAVTALLHGAVVQKSRGGMARTNTFLGILPFWLFLLGTFLTRSGALAGKDASGQLLSVHAFDNIEKSAGSLLIIMLALYGGCGLLLWLARLRSMPRRPSAGETLISRDFAFFMAVTLMLAACVIVTVATTSPILQGWMHRPISAPKPRTYNTAMLPLTALAALLMGCAPWLAWKRTNPDEFLRRLAVPWIGMLLFGFFMLFWVNGAARDLLATFDTQSVDVLDTQHAWISPAVQRIAVIVLASFGFLAALSNAILAFRVFRARPLAAGGWLAHVGIGMLIIGVIISNTYERTTRITLEQGDPPGTAFGYQFTFEKMTGKPPDARPLNPDYDRGNRVAIRVTPPGANDSGAAPDTAGFGGAPRTFVSEMSWFVHNIDAPDVTSEDQYQRMRWPAITKTLGHDLYLGLADDPGYKVPTLTLKPREWRDIGPYRLGYFKDVVDPGRYIGAHLILVTADRKVIELQPGKRIVPSSNTDEPGQMVDVDIAVPQVRDEHGIPGAIYLRSLNAADKSATLMVNLPDYGGRWEIPLEVTYKPWVNLVWTGVIVATLGTLLAMVRRTREGQGESGSEPSPFEPSAETAVAHAKQAPPKKRASRKKAPA